MPRYGWFHLVTPLRGVTHPVALCATIQAESLSDVTYPLAADATLSRARHHGRTRGVDRPKMRFTAVRCNEGTVRSVAPGDWTAKAKSSDHMCQHIGKIVFSDMRHDRQFCSRVRERVQTADIPADW